MSASARGESSRASYSWRLLFAVLALLAIVVAGYVYWSYRPIVSEAEIERATERVARFEEIARRIPTSRAPLRPPADPPVSQAEFDAFALDPFDCVRPTGQTTSTQDGLFWSTPPQPGRASRFSIVSPGVYLSPEDAAGVGERCAKEVARLQRIAATTTLMAPTHQRTETVTILESLGHSFLLLVAGTAQAAWRGGDVDSALTIVEDGIAALHDARRGPMMGYYLGFLLETEALLIGYYATILYEDFALSDDDLERHLATLRLLVETHPSPAPALYSVRIFAARDLRSITPFPELLDRAQGQAVETIAVAPSCDPPATTRECLEAVAVLRSQGIPASLPFLFALRRKRQDIRSFVRQDLPARDAALLTRWRRAELSLRMLGALLRAAARRDEGCPEDGASVEVVGFANAAFEHLGSETYYLTPPPIEHAERDEPRALPFACPPVSFGWYP